MRTVPIQLGRCGLMLSIVLTLASATPQKVYLDMNSTTVGTGTEDGEDVFTGPTYSVIVVASNPRPSNQFRDEKRVRCFNTLSGGRDVVSVQFGDPSPDKPPGIDEPPFGARHADGVSKRVRLIFRADVNGQSDNQVAHLRAACEDKNETTVIITVDETCRWGKLPQRYPSICASNVIRIYPFNGERRPDLGLQEAYVPLGPRNTFPFVPREIVPSASDRSLFFNLQVSTTTSERRKSVVAIAKMYSETRPDVPNVSQLERLAGTQWQDMLLNSTFTLSPGGHNAETFRMWEALEAGSIPIVSKLDYTHPGYSYDHSCGSGDTGWNTVASSPFVKEASVEAWDDLPMLLDKLWQKSDDYLNRLQEDCMAWYTARMNRTYDSLLNFGEGNDMFPQLGPILDLPEG